MDSRPRALSADELKSMLQNAANGGVAAANDFFNGFPFVRKLHDDHNYSAALREGMQTLAHCQSVDAQAYQAVHKGTPFYWLGTAAFLSYDYQTAVFFFDAAASEDLRAGHDPTERGTPALLFIQLDAGPQEQAARGLVEEAQRLCEHLIQEYNQMAGAASLNLDDLRESLLRPAVSEGHPHWRSLATAFTSFLLEYGHRVALLRIRHADGTAEPFFLHLWKGCVLFESLLKANPQGCTGHTLGPLLHGLSSQLGTGGSINIGGTTLPAVVTGLADADTTVDTAVAFTGRLRNTLGHDLSWQVALSPSEYHRLFQMVATSCLHAIACLYR